MNLSHPAPGSEASAEMPWRRSVGCGRLIAIGEGGHQAGALYFHISHWDYSKTRHSVR
jgi:hypothetical protein